jgi:hypothetical protein
LSDHVDTAMPLRRMTGLTSQAIGIATAAGAHLLERAVKP